MPDLESALSFFRRMAEEGEPEEQAVAYKLARFLQEVQRDQRRARIAGTRMLKEARRYRRALTRKEKHDKL